MVQIIAMARLMYICMYMFILYKVVTQRYVRCMYVAAKLQTYTRQINMYHASLRNIPLLLFHDSQRYNFHF